MSMRYEPNLGLLEIAITYVCNVKCNNCCTLSTQAPTQMTENITLEAIQRFIAESVEVSYPWKWIKLHGGEPTLHPEFLEICRLLADYRNQHNPTCELSVCSNGSRMDKVNAALALGFTPQVSVKVKTNKDISGAWMPYVRVNESPKDLGMEPIDCYVPNDCGLGLNNDGFYPCAPIAGAARVFHYITPCKHVRDITVENLRTLLAHCEHCGFAIKQPRAAEQVTSPTWDAKLKEYNASR